MDLKKILLNTEYFKIKGKKGRNVPVMVPCDVKEIFKAVVDFNSARKTHFFFAKYEHPNKVHSSVSLKKVILFA